MSFNARGGSSHLASRRDEECSGSDSYIDDEISTGVFHDAIVVKDDQHGQEGSQDFDFGI